MVKNGVDGLVESAFCNHFTDMTDKRANLLVWCMLSHVRPPSMIGGRCHHSLDLAICKAQNRRASKSKHRSAGLGVRNQVECCHEGLHNWAVKKTALAVSSNRNTSVL